MHYTLHRRFGAFTNGCGTIKILAWTPARQGLEVEKIALKLGRGGAGGYDSGAGGYGVGAIAYGSGVPQQIIKFRSEHSHERWLEEVIDVTIDFWISNYFAQVG